jgi:protein TonB
VVLRITVNATGRPTHVEILKSSGYPRLDRAALEAGWRCRIRNATAGDQFDAPLRFNLQN